MDKDLQKICLLKTDLSSSDSGSSSFWEAFRPKIEKVGRKWVPMFLRTSYSVTVLMFCIRFWDSLLIWEEWIPKVTFFCQGLLILDGGRKRLIISQFSLSLPNQESDARSRDLLGVMLILSRDTPYRLPVMHSPHALESVHIPSTWCLETVSVQANVLYPCHHNKHRQHQEGE